MRPRLLLAGGLTLFVAACHHRASTPSTDRPSPVRVVLRAQSASFADSHVAVERVRRGPHPHAWNAALALDSPAPAARWRALRDRPH